MSFVLIAILPTFLLAQATKVPVPAPVKNEAVLWRPTPMVVNGIGPPPWRVMTLVGTPGMSTVPPVTDTTSASRHCPPRSSLAWTRLYPLKMRFGRDGSRANGGT